jgi:hypothetical protein
LEREEIVNKNLQFGLLAEEVEAVFPELIARDNAGYLSVDYIGLIPVIVESIKEQQQIINAQSEKIKELEILLGTDLTEKPDLRAGTNDDSATTLNTVSSEILTSAFLYQNAPNPFQVKTEIRYFLPQEVQSAEIYIFNMKGNLIKKIPAGNSGRVEIKAADLSAGM